MNKARPILFNGAMVRAILAGQKTQTRRAVKVPPAFDFIGGAGDDQNDPKNFGAEDENAMWWALAAGPDTDHVLACPFGQPGDRLWVRETWADVNTVSGPAFTYRADNGLRWCRDDAFPVQYKRYPGMSFAMWCADLWAGQPEHRWRPSIHMPRWACRLVLEIIAVRVERLQVLPDADWEAEGITFCMEDSSTAAGHAFNEAEHYAIAGVSMRGTPEDHGMRAQFAEQGLDWDSNPWVWVIEFKAVTP